MLKQLKTTIRNSHDSLLGDAIGMAALMVAFVAVLFLPGVF